MAVIVLSISPKLSLYKTKKLLRMTVSQGTLRVNLRLMSVIYFLGGLINDMVPIKTGNTQTPKCRPMGMQTMA